MPPVFKQPARTLRSPRQLIQVPAIVKPSVPFLGVQGFMVTKFADGHGVGGAATDLVTNFFASASACVASTLAWSAACARSDSIAATADFSASSSVSKVASRVDSAAAERR